MLVMPGYKPTLKTLNIGASLVLVNVLNYEMEDQRRRKSPFDDLYKDGDIDW